MIPGITASLACISLAIAAAAAPPEDSGYARDAARGERLLRAGESDSAIAPLLAAHARGMPEDSLFWFLSEAALRKTALDTAMAFNLAIGTPAPGPFRDSILAQRYRIYVASGLTRDASALRDSLPRTPEVAGARTAKLTARAGTGWFGERNEHALSYPFAADLGGYSPTGAENRVAADIDAPLFRAGTAAFAGGFGMQALKSYAKDSLDYRISAGLREEGLLSPALSIDLGAEGGRITGSGWVGACKGGATWLSFSAGGLDMITSGVQAEWDERGRERYGNAWLGWYRDASVAGGRGFNFTVSFSAFRSAPTVESADWRVMFVDDVRKPSPVHFTGPDFKDTVTANKINASTRYSSAVMTLPIGSRSPQSSLALLPAIGYTLPLPWRLSAEASLSARGAWYPEEYAWETSPLPPSAVGDVVFRGFALNREDGAIYAANLNAPNGGFSESYAAAPLRKLKRTRLDGEGGLEASLRRPFAGWGALSATAMAKRTASTVGGSAPIWIPAWDAGVSIAWRGNWDL